MCCTVESTSNSLRSFGELYRSHFPFVWTSLRRHGVAEADLEDTTQDAFLVVFRSRQRAPHVPAKSWLYGIVRRVASNYRRGQRRNARKERAYRSVLATQGFAPHGEHDAALALECFVKSLPLKFREVFVLAEIYKMTGREIGQALDISPNTAAARLRRARRALDKFGHGQPTDTWWPKERPKPRDEAPTAVQARVWSALGPQLKTRTLLGVGIWAKTAAGVGASLAALAALTLVSPTPSAAPRPDTPVRGIDSRSTLEGSRSQLHIVSPSPQPAVASRAPEGPPQASSTRRKPRGGRARLFADAAPPVGLAQQTKLLLAARSALRAKEYARVQRLASNYARRHPDGFFVREFARHAELSKAAIASSRAGVEGKNTH